MSQRMPDYESLRATQARAQEGHGMSGVNVEWREDVDAAFKGTHVFMITPCYWTSDPEEDPDMRGVCAHCGLDEELGNHNNPCTKRSHIGAAP